VLEALFYRFQDGVGGREIHICHPEGQDVATFVQVPFSAVGVVAIDFTIKCSELRFGHT
jgi:hypothetical protein